MTIGASEPVHAGERPAAAGPPAAGPPPGLAAAAAAGAAGRDDAPEVAAWPDPAFTAAPVPGPAAVFVLAEEPSADPEEPAAAEAPAAGFPSVAVSDPPDAAAGTSAVGELSAAGGAVLVSAACKRATSSSLDVRVPQALAIKPAASAAAIMLFVERRDVFAPRISISP
jgi:hypothetical protein